MNDRVLHEAGYRIVSTETLAGCQEESFSPGGLLGGGVFLLTSPFIERLTFSRGARVGSFAIWTYVVRGSAAAT